MAAHKSRSGQLKVSFSCKEDRHGTECDRFLAELENVIVCHCECHPDDGCRPTIRRTTRRNPTCGVCYLVHPIGACDATG